MMKRRLPLLALAAFSPVAWAHEPGWVFGMMFWQLALIVGLLLFLVMPSYRLKIKLAATAGFVLAPALFVGLVLLIKPLDALFIPGFALTPIAGFFAGLYYAKRRTP